MAAPTSADGSAALRGVRALGAAALLLLGLAIVGVAAVLLLAPVPEPVARLDLVPPPAPAAAPPPPAAAEVPLPPVKAVTVPVYAGHALLADPALIESAAAGPLPRVAADGRRPMTAYAAPAASGPFRIAIVVTGLGLSAKATENALAVLPPAVSVAFLPYAADVGRWVAAARAKGHEVLLELPMEPFDFPDSDPGPHTLRAGGAAGANPDRLDWALSRFTGYAGVTNLLGGRLLSDSDALTPILTELRRRGLYFYDGGAVPQSIAPEIAGTVVIPFAQSGAQIDTIQTAFEIDRRLSDLETAARAHGSAAGTAFLYPVSVRRIALWAASLKGRGFVLVPVSAIVAQPK